VGSRQAAQHRRKAEPLAEQNRSVAEPLTMLAKAIRHPAALLEVVLLLKMALENDVEKSSN
jgi:hypothetical protein